MTLHSPNSDASAAGRVVLAGIGNIGSHIVPLLARMHHLVREILLVDPQKYAAENVASQAATAADVGKAKVTVQARELRRINPNLQVAAIQDRIENVPLGLLRSRVLIAGLDSREARRSVNLAAWRLGIPWIDAAVDAAGLLVRVNVYVPGSGATCMECAWDDAEYAALEHRFGCDGQLLEPASTNAPSSLGALAAGLQAVECMKLLSGQTDRLAAGNQVLLDANYHKHYVTRLPHNPLCRFDHATWRIERLDVPLQMSLGDFFLIADGLHATARSVALEASPVVTQLACVQCGRQPRGIFRLSSRLSARDRKCAGCSGNLSPFGFGMLDRLERAELTQTDLRRSLASIGFRVADVLTVHDDVDVHYELAG
jgi:molybdopterin-synthase adenylyltransferase